MTVWLFIVLVNNIHEDLLSIKEHVYALKNSLIPGTAFAKMSVEWMFLLFFHCVAFSLAQSKLLYNV